MLCSKLRAVESVLAKFLAPITVAEFYEKYYRRKCLVIPGGKDKILSIFGREMTRKDLAHALFEDFDDSALCNMIGVRIDKTRLGTASHRGYPHFAVSQEVTAAAALQHAAITHVVSDIEDGVEEYLELRKDLTYDLPFWSANRLTVFSGGPGVQTMSHFDQVETLQLMVDGERTWWYDESEPYVQYYPFSSLAYEEGMCIASESGELMDVPLPGDPRLTETTLRAGDAIYVPAGHVHCVTGDHSALAITLGHYPISYRTIFQNMVGNRYCQREESNAPIPFLGRGPSSDRYARPTKELREAALFHLDESRHDEKRTVFSLARMGTLAPSPAAPLQAPAAPRDPVITEETPVRFSPKFRASTFRDERTTYLFFSDYSDEYLEEDDPHIGTILEQIVNQRSFTAKSLAEPTPLLPGDVVPVLSFLVNSGFCEVIS